jgi:hypothetical protein
VTLGDGTSGNNSVSSAGDTSASKGKALNYYAGTGTDRFTGGFENDSISVSAAAVGGDVLTGGSGTNTLILASAGAANLGGVSKFATIHLAAGNNTLTVTDTTLSGGSVTLSDGTTGNNTVTVSDTAASEGKTLTYMAGGGADNFTGGYENDTIYAGTGSGTYTFGLGSDKLMFIADNLPTQTIDNFNAATDDIVVYGVHATNGFDLGSTDNGLNPLVGTSIDPSIFVANASGDFTSSSQRFAYDTGNYSTARPAATVPNPTLPRSLECLPSARATSCSRIRLMRPAAPRTMTNNLYCVRVTPPPQRPAHSTAARSDPAARCRPVGAQS